MPGAPTRDRAAKPRRARSAWVVEVEPAGEQHEETAAGVCIVVDAATGKVIGRWPGIADRPDRGPVARASGATQTFLWIGDAGAGANRSAA